jgi:hypothetical protein
MCVDELNKSTEENRERFAAAGGRIYQAASAFMNGLPGLFLEKKWLATITG